MDNKTGEIHARDDALRPQLEVALRLGTPPPAPVESAPANTAGVERPGSSTDDLSSNVAGQAARQRALELKEAAPVRTMLARALRVHTDERAWRIGADGEEKVAKQLQKLGTDWRVLHAIRVGAADADIDHLVVGPGGVFSVNAKMHPGAKIWVGGDTVMVNGQRMPYIRNSRHEARRAGRLLTAACGFPVSVVGVVAVVAATDLTIKAAPVDVHVIARRQIARWLHKQPAVLDGDLIRGIFEAARLAPTWQPGPSDV